MFLCWLQKMECRRIVWSFLTVCFYGGCFSGTTNEIEDNGKEYILLSETYNWRKAEDSCETFGHTSLWARPTPDLNQLKDFIKKFYKSGNLTTDVLVGKCKTQGFIDQLDRWSIPLEQFNLCGDDQDEDECSAITGDEQHFQSKKCNDDFHVICLRNSNVSETSMTATGNTAAITDTTTADINPTTTFVQSSWTHSVIAATPMDTYTAFGTAPTAIAASSTTTAADNTIDAANATMGDSGVCGCGTRPGNETIQGTRDPGRDRVETKTLSSYRRSKTSTMDYRPSAVSIGVLGFGILTSVALFIVMKDIITLWVWLVQYMK